MIEIPKRLVPTKGTLIRLFAKSKNECTYPNCQNVLFDSFNNFIGHIAHIQGALEESPRFNRMMTNEERRSYENLILLCPYHHNVVDIQVEYHTVDYLSEIRKTHEAINSTLEEIISDQKLNSVLVNLYEVNEKLDSIMTTQNLSRHKEEHIEWLIDESSRRRMPLKRAKNIFVIGSVSASLIFLSIPMLYTFDFQLSYFSYLVILPCLFLVCFGVLMIAYIAPKGSEIFNGTSFTKKNEDGSVDIYEKYAKCNWPRCEGVVRLRYPPEKEKDNYEIIGRCSHEQDHTFTYQKNGLGYYRKMDFSPIIRQAK